MKIIITGSNGQLGNSLVSLLNAGSSPLGNIPDAFKNCRIYPIDIDQVDITDPASVNNYVDEVKPDIIINCAAMTNVDACETQEELANKINSYGVKLLAAAAEKNGSKFVHISTDYVFSGDASQPYIETDSTSPCTAYGRSKLLGEQAALSECSKTFIFRTAWLFGYIGKNFVKTIRNIGIENNQISVVNDQIGNPTLADDLAFHILAVSSTENYGIYHCTGEGECSWYDFACEIIRLSKIDCSVVPCSTEASARPAPRPEWSLCGCPRRRRGRRGCCRSIPWRRSRRLKSRFRGAGR